WPFKKAENPDVRTTDDHFLMEVSLSGNEDEAIEFFKNTGAVEVKVVEK
ncbi:quinol:electron acceptor oxidoreductase subunit ActD, partial [Avrilella dinanensis]